MAALKTKAAAADLAEVARRRAEEQDRKKAEALARAEQNRLTAEERARRNARDPEKWGIDPDQLKLETANDVAVPPKKGRRSDQVVRAERLDPFDQLHRNKGKDGKRGLDIEQHRAAGRLIRDNAQRRGIRVGELRDIPQLWTLVDRSDHQIPVTDGMLRAGDRISLVLSMVGPRSAQLLRGIIEPMFDGELKPWRERVQELTAEGDRMVQGALVRAACEDLRLAYEAIDRGRRPGDGRGPL